MKVSLPLKRIVSLVPSQTELLIYLGLEEKIVGRTKFCIHPKSQVKGIPIVGGTKTVNHDKILAIRPDIIIGNKEENTKEDIDTLSKDFPVWLSDINNLDNALGMILSLSEIFDKSQKGQMLVDNITSGFHSLEGRLEISVLYLIWEKPYMGVGNDTFINDIIIRAGYKNALSNRERYPKITDKEIVDINPDIIFLSTEPFPFKQIHIEKLKNILPETPIKVVDGEFFSWYGSRLLQAIPYLEKLQIWIKKLNWEI